MNNLKKYKIDDESFENDEEDQAKTAVNQIIGNNPLSSTLISNIHMENEVPGKKQQALAVGKYDKERGGEVPNPSGNEVDNVFDNSEIEITDMLNINLQKENTHKAIPSEITNNNNNNNTNNNNFHHVQIIDEDVENFRRRLDIMIKNFRTDTVKDFMGIKRNLLKEQKTIIESEKQKCEAQLSAKSDTIEHLKEDLVKTKTALAKEEEIKERMSKYLHKRSFGKYIHNLKTFAFIKGLKWYHDRKKKLKRVFNKIRGNLIARLRSKGMVGLKRNYAEIKTMKVILAKEKEFQEKLNEMAQYYGKEIADLRSRLDYANQAVVKYKESKNLIQDNLKKALMRGVVAMNLEAMNVLDDELDGKATVPAVEDMTNVNIIGVNQSNNALEKKAVVKDSNWVNACAVPIKMKSNILAKEEDNDNEIYNDNEPGERNHLQNIELKQNEGRNISNQYQSSSNYYDELQKNLSSIKNDFSIIKNNSNAIGCNNININEDSNIYEKSSGFYLPQGNVSVNVNPNTDRDNVFTNNYNQLNSRSINPNTENVKTDKKKLQVKGNEKTTQSQSVASSATIASNTTSSKKQTDIKKKK